MRLSLMSNGFNVISVDKEIAKCQRMNFQKKIFSDHLIPTQSTSKKSSIEIQFLNIVNLSSDKLFLPWAMGCSKFDVKCQSSKLMKANW
jgi:hypothetical protein